jgi:hypothetical protein
VEGIGVTVAVVVGVAMGVAVSGVEAASVGEALALGTGVGVGCSGAHTKGKKPRGEIGEMGESKPVLSSGLARNCHESKLVSANARSTTMIRRWLKLGFIKRENFHAYGGGGLLPKLTCMRRRGASEPMR